MPLLLPNKFIKAANTLAMGRTVTTLGEWSMRDILSSLHRTDAHMLLYSPAGEGIYPVRYRKRSGAAEYLQTEWLAFDYDLPDHRAWVDEAEVEEVADKLMSDSEGDFYAIYTTTHGARLILRLPEPHPVLHVEALHKHLLSTVFTHTGYDRQCSDWTRTFRLPYVIRDGVELWEDPLTELVIADKVYDIIVPTVMPELTALSDIVGTSAPSEASRNLVWQDPD